MRPDQRWFPTSRVDRAAWFANFAANFAVYGPILRFSSEDIASVQADNAMVQYLTRSATAYEAYTKALKAAEKTLLFGRRGETTPNIPTPPEYIVPDAVETGIFERLERRVRQIRTMPEYNSAIGASLGILRKQPERIALAEFSPRMSILPSAEPYSFVIKFVKGSHRAGFAEIQRKGDSKWEKIRAFSRSPVSIRIEPTTPGMPEEINVRMALLIDNEKIAGNYSFIKTITITP